ncbi:MAG: glycoside hydrolase family 3 C-terminal domain-containing protein [Anaerolineae bacterium]|nr:glycoside hydrolase family 3 C-terminal domain-containing protein [Anaerolineae bacterium]
MTLEEKAAICTGVNAWQTVPVERLGIPSMWVSDGPHGVRRATVPDDMMAANVPATCFPTASALAATWDRDLIYELGQALGEECIALNVDLLLGPGVNIKRSPLCGRNFEYFSEDPYLAGEMAATFINGVQSKGVGTSLKHFAANNQEFQRFSISAEVDDRTLREIYLAGFERAVKQAQPWSVMCAYNKLNGTLCSQHHWLLTDVLHDEWGYKGFVVSDWGAVDDRVASLAAGLALEMPGPQPRRVQAVIDAVHGGTLDEARLDEMVRQLLAIVLRAQETPKGGTRLNVDGHHALARRIAGETMVLLKNEGGLLPLRGVNKIAVIGVTAREAHYQGGGSAHVTPTRVDVPFDELAALAGDAELIYAPGYKMEEGFAQAMIDEAVAVARAAEVALLYIGLPPFKESEGYDRPDIDLTDQQVALIKAVAAVQPKTVVILNNGSALAMSDWIDGVPAVLEAWMMGQAGGGAIADVLFGKVNPGGKLAETFPLKLSDTPSHINFPGEVGQVCYGEGIFVGYRYYDEKDMPVLFPFGYGLSYTSFAYNNLTVSAKTFKDVDGLTVSVDVTNTGSVAGKEIVQVYVHDHEAKLRRPQKELKGFVKVALEPGETKTVSVTLDNRAFAYWDPRYNDWVNESGQFDILVGSSSADIRETATVTLESTQQLPPLINRYSTLGEWVSDPAGAAALTPIMQMFQAHAPTGSDMHGIDFFSMLRDMPLLKILGWFAGNLPTDPDTMVDQLVAQVHNA